MDKKAKNTLDNTLRFQSSLIELNKNNLASEQKELETLENDADEVRKEMEASEEGSPVRKTLTDKLGYYNQLIRMSEEIIEQYKLNLKNLNIENDG